MYVQRLRQYLIIIVYFFGATSAFAQGNSTGANVNPEPQAVTEKSSESWGLLYDFYGEAYSAVQYDGLVNQARLRLLYPITEGAYVYSGVYWSEDATKNTGGLRYADDFVSPTAGVLYKPWSFLGLFAEYRRLFRTENNELPGAEHDPRYGVYGYYLYEFPVVARPHLEFYGESVALTRFTSKPISTAWLKLGSEQHVVRDTLTITPYLEYFLRESPNLMLGFDDRSLRLGGKLKYRWKNYSVQWLAYRRFHSDQTPLGWESLIVFAADGSVGSWN